MSNSVFILLEGYYDDAEIKGVYPLKANGIKAMEELYIRRKGRSDRDAKSLHLEEYLLNTDPDLEESYVDILLMEDLLDCEPELEEASKERWKDANESQTWKREYSQQFYHRIDFEEEEE